MEKLEYFLVRLLYVIFRLIPHNMGQNISNFMAFIVERVIRYRRKIIMDNLKSAFPEKQIKEINSIKKDVYKNFIALWAEVLQSWRLNPQYFKNNWQINNWEVIEDAVSENKGMILISGHMGNFEWLGFFIASVIDTPTYAIMKEIRNPYINDFMVKNRKNNGIDLIYTGRAMKKGIQALRKQSNIGIVADVSGFLSRC